MQSRARRLGKRILVALAATLVLATGLVWYLIRSGAGSEIGRRKLELGLGAATGCEVRIGTLSTDFLSGQAVLHDVAIRCDGREVVTAGRVEAGYTLGALLGSGAIQLPSLAAESVVISLDLDALPTRWVSPRSGTRAAATRLRIGRFALTGSRLELRQASRRFEVVIPDLEVRSEALFDNGKVVASLEAEGTRVTLGERAVEPLTLRAGIHTDGRTLEVGGARVELPGTASLDLEASALRPDGAPGRVSWNARFSAEGDVRALEAFLAPGLAPPGLTVSGGIRLEGEARGEGKTYEITGRARSPVLSIGEAGISDLDATWTLAPGDLSADRLHARVFEGETDLRLRARRLGAAWTLDYVGRLDRVRPERLPLSAPLREQLLSLGSVLAVTVEGSLPLSDPRRATATWSATLSSTGSPAGGLAAEALLSGTLSDGTLHIEAGRAQAAGMVGELKGAIVLDPELALEVRISTQDPVAFITALSPRFPYLDALNRLQLSGRFSFTGALTGPIAAPRLSGRLEAEGIRAGDLPIGSLSADLLLEGPEVVFNRVAVRGPLADVDASGRARIAEPVALDARWEAHAVSLWVLAAAFGHEWLASGLLDGDGRAFLRDGRPILSGRLSGRDLFLKDMPVGEVQIEAEADAEHLTLGRVSLASAGGSAELSGSLPWEGEGGRLQVEVRDYPLAGAFSIEDLTGTVSLRGSVEGSIRQLHPAEPMAFSIGHLAWKRLGPVDLAGHLSFAEGDVQLDLRDAEERLRGEARIGLGAGRTSSGTLRLEPLDLLLPPNPAGEAIHLTLGGAEIRFEGPLDEPERLVSSAEVDEIALRAETWSVRSLEPIRVRGSGREVQLTPIPFSFDEQRLVLEGSAVLEEVPRLDLSLSGMAEIDALGPLVGAQALSGQADLTLRAEGPWNDVSLEGSGEVRNGYLRIAGFPHALQRVAGRVELSGHQMRVVSFRGDLGGGRATGSGEITLTGVRPESFRFDAEGTGVALRFPPEISSLSDFSIHLEGQPDGSLLTGRVSVIRARYSKDFQLERALYSRPLPPPRIAPRGVLDRVRLDLEVAAPGQVFLDNDLGRAEFQADLRVRGTAAAPALDGAVGLVRPGRLRFRDLDYTLSGAFLTFVPEAPNDPEIDAQAETRVDPYDVTVRVTGSASSPRVDFTADPELPREQVVGLLLSGGSWAPDTRIGGSGGQPESFYTSPIGLMPSTVGSAVGLDTLRLDAVYDRGSAEADTRLTVGKRISRKVSAAYSTLLGNTGGDLFELRYQLSPHFQVRQIREEDASNVLETSYVTTFDTGSPHGATGGEPRSRTSSRKPSDSEFVRIAGLPPGPDTDAARKAIGLEPGDWIGRRNLLLASERAREVLAKRGHPMARVDCVAGEAGSVDCQVEAGPRILLQIDGVGRRREQRRLHDAVREAWTEALGMEELTSEAVDAAENFYRGRGRMHVKATCTLETSPDATRVQMVVQRGPRVRIHQVTFEGIRQIDQETLHDSLESLRHEGLRHPVLTPDRLSFDMQRLAWLYYNAGFPDARIDPPEVTYPRKPDDAAVTFQVEEGSRALLSRVDFDGNRLYDDETLRARLGTAPGAPLDPPAIERFTRELRADYDLQGYPDASVSWRLESEVGGVAVRFQIREGDFSRIGSIRVEGNHRTREEIIRRELTVRSGDPLRQRDLLVSQRRLDRLGIFRSAVVRPNTVSPETTARDVVVRVDERDNMDLSVGLGYDDEEGARYSFSIGRRNLRGGTGALNFYSRYGSEDRLAQILSTSRHVGGSRNDFLASLAVREEVRPGFTVDRSTLALQISRPIVEDRSTIQYGYRVQNIHVPVLNVSPFEAGVTEALIAGVRAGLLRNNRDDLLDPRQGGLETINLEVNAAALGSEEEYVKLFLQHSHHWSFHQRHLGLAAAGRLGAAWVFGDTTSVPLSERFLAGGVNSVRGFERDRLGPLDPATLQPVGGESVLIFNTELRVSLTERISGVLFLDAGNVYAKPTDLDLSELRYAAGPGFAYSTPVGPLRLFLGRKLDPLPGEATWEFQFTFGPTF